MMVGPDGAIEVGADQRLALMAAAWAAAARAYVPYSSFPVGAAVLTADGSVVAGCNVENASYGLTCCAERTAVFTAVAAGHRTILAVAVTAPAATRASPCGACRQVLREFVGPAGMLVLQDGAEGVEETTLATLLPDSFGPGDLGA